MGEAEKEKRGRVEARHSGYWADSGDVEMFRRTMWGYASHRGRGNLE